MPAVSSHLQDFGQLAKPSASLIERFIKPLKWLSASKKLAAVMGIGLPLALLPPGAANKVVNGNAINTLASLLPA
ncbi:MAG: hypothetical protein U1E91_06260 [Moraxella sp.]